MAQNSKVEKLIIYGRQPVMELLHSDHPATAIYLANELKHKNTITDLARKKNLTVKFIAKAEMQKITGPVLHQGLAVELPGFRYLLASEMEQMLTSVFNGIYVVLDQVQDPHNLGAIIRSAEISGVTALILSQKSSAEINSTVAKTSAGAVFHLPVFQTGDLGGFIEHLRDKQVSSFALAAGNASTIFETDFKSACAIVIGSEGKGVRKNILRLCDQVISIPQFGRVNSLNASVSAAVVLFEIVRQRKF